MASDYIPYMKLILASASPRRLDLLTTIGFKPDIVDAADIDETPYKNEKPDLYAIRCGREKAEVTAGRHAEGIIIAADTMVALGRRIIGKAEDRAGAFRDLSLMQGRNHRVYTGMSIIKKEDGKFVQASHKLVATTVRFKRMSPDEINWYLDTNEWEGKSGSFTLMGIAAGFIEQVKGSHTNIIGLPLCEARQILIGMGLRPQNLAKSA